MMFGEAFCHQQLYGATQSITASLEDIIAVSYVIGNLPKKTQLMAAIGKMILTWDPDPRWSCLRTGSLSAGRSPPRRPRGSGSGPSRRRTQSPSFSSTSSSGCSRSCSGRCRRSRKLWKPWPEQISAFYLFSCIKITFRVREKSSASQTWSKSSFDSSSSSGKWNF